MIFLFVQVCLIILLQDKNYIELNVRSARFIVSCAIKVAEHCSVLFSPLSTDRKITNTIFLHKSLYISAQIVRSVMSNGVLG